jgi:putative serine protease PepD
MDDGKPTGPKAKWWSRPSAGRATTHSEPEATGPADTEVTAELPPVQPPLPVSLPQPAERAQPAELVDEAVQPGQYAQPAPASGRAKPLHEPDPYGTPPYGGPGPWAPAPPVQRPLPTPAQSPPMSQPQGAPMPPPQ